MIYTSNGSYTFYIVVLYVKGLWLHFRYFVQKHITGQWLVPKIFIENTATESQFCWIRNRIRILTEILWQKFRKVYSWKNVLLKKIEYFSLNLKKGRSDSRRSLQAFKELFKYKFHLLFQFLGTTWSAGSEFRIHWTILIRIHSGFEKDWYFY